MDTQLLGGAKSYPLALALQMEALIKELPNLNANSLPWVKYKADVLKKELETYGA